MKKLLLSFVFIVFALTSMEVKAGTVSLDSTSFWHSAPCDSIVYFNLSGHITGYGTGDSVQVYYNFGDGTSYTELIQTDTAGQGFYHSTNHTYTIPGIYSIQYIVTASDLAADTVVRPNAIIYGSSCGNIKGRVYLDNNSDCIYNGNDTGVVHVRVNALLNNQIVYSTWTNNKGEYSIEVASNNTYTIQLGNNIPFKSHCPSGGSYTISSIPSSANDFGVSCVNTFDLRGGFSSASIPGQTNNSLLVVINSFCQPKSGTVQLIFEDSLFSYVGNASTTPTSINGDTIEWNFSNVSYLINAGITFFTKTDTLAKIGDTVCVKVIVSPQVGDSIPANNIKEFCFPVRSSYDPNTKEAQPLGIGSTGKIASNTDLTYTINFQNTGNFQAYNIYIMDTLDNSVLDPSTIEILGSSHAMKTALISVNQNVLRFGFEGINLPDSNSNEAASHGWVSYSIKQQPNLGNGKKIENSAAIYFDYNPPVITNSTLNTIDNTLVGIQPMGAIEANFANFYPNPTTDVFNIEFSGNETATYELNIYNINGQLLRQMKTNKKVQQIDVSSLETGIYLLEVRNENGQRQMNKIVVGK